MLALFDDELVSQTYLRKVDLKLHDIILQGEGVGGVGTYSHKRGKGYARLLLTRSLEFMKKRGSSIAFLYPDPVTYEFYEKYGFALACDRLKVKLTSEQINECKPLNDYKHSIENYEVLDAFALHAGELSNIYTRYMANYSFYTLRPKGYFEMLAYNNGGYDHLSILKVNGTISAYALWEHDKDTINIDELIGDDLSRLILMNSLIKDENTPCVTFYTSINDSIVDMFHSDMPAKKIPHDAFRILDFIRCYSGALTHKDDECIYIHVIDKLIKSNAGVFKLSIYNGKTTVVREDSAKPQFSGDIMAYTQILTGYKTINDCIEDKSIKVMDTKALMSYFDIFDRKKIAYILDVL